MEESQTNISVESMPIEIQRFLKKNEHKKETYDKHYFAINYLLRANEKADFDKLFSINPKKLSRSREEDIKEKAEEYVTNAVIEMVKKPLGYETIKNYISSIKMLFEDKHINLEPTTWKKIKGLQTKGESIKIQEPAPTKDEMQQILANMDAIERAYALVAVSTGLRPSDILDIELKDLHLDNKPPEITIKKPCSITKKRLSFTYITEEAKEEIQIYLKQRPRYFENKKIEILKTKKNTTTNHNNRNLEWVRTPNNEYQLQYLEPNTGILKPFGKTITENEYIIQEDNYHKREAQLAKYFDEQDKLFPISYKSMQRRFYNKCIDAGFYHLNEKGEKKSKFDLGITRSYFRTRLGKEDLAEFLIAHADIHNLYNRKTEEEIKEDYKLFSNNLLIKKESSIPESTKKEYIEGFEKIKLTNIEAKITKLEKILDQLKNKANPHINPCYEDSTLGYNGNLEWIRTPNNEYQLQYLELNTGILKLFGEPITEEEYINHGGIYYQRGAELAKYLYDNNMTPQIIYLNLEEIVYFYKKEEGTEEYKGAIKEREKFWQQQKNQIKKNPK